MIATVITSMIAVLGTLGGVAFTGWTADRRERSMRRESRRIDAIRAVAELVAALSAYRRAAWVYECARLRGEGTGELRSVRHAARGALDVPLTTLRVLVPGLARIAQEAVSAINAQRGVETASTLDALRQAARDASDRLVAAAAEQLA